MKKQPLSAVNAVLNKVLSNLGLDQRLREHTFMGLWPTFVNSAIEQRSRALFIDSQRNLVITVADAATGQELSMIKGKVLAKVAAAARSLNIEVRGLRIDLKHYHAVSTSPIIEEEKPLPKPQEAEIAAVVLTAADSQAISDLKRQLEGGASGEPEAGTQGPVRAPLDPKLQAKIIAVYERELRIRRWRFLNNFPVCPQCDNPVERLHAPESAAPLLGRSGPPVCLSCLYAGT